MGARSGKRERDKEGESKGDRDRETDRETENARPRKTTLDNAQRRKTRHDKAKQRKRTQDKFEAKLGEKGTPNEGNIDPNPDPKTSQNRSRNGPKALPNRACFDPKSAKI